LADIDKEAPRRVGPLVPQSSLYLRLIVVDHDPHAINAVSQNGPHDRRVGGQPERFLRAPLTVGMSWHRGKQRHPAALNDANLWRLIKATYRRNEGMDRVLDEGRIHVGPRRTSPPLAAEDDAAVKAGVFRDTERALHVCQYSPRFVGVVGPEDRERVDEEFVVFAFVSERGDGKLLHLHAGLRDLGGPVLVLLVSRAARAGQPDRAGFLIGGFFFESAIDPV
jgi:hypothetical protein